jgi:hypothetical protein
LNPSHRIHVQLKKVFKWNQIKESQRESIRVSDCIYINNEPRYNFKFWEICKNECTLFTEWTCVMIHQGSKVLWHFENIVFWLCRARFSLLQCNETYSIWTNTWFITTFTNNTMCKFTRSISMLKRKGFDFWASGHTYFIGCGDSK